MVDVQSATAESRRGKKKEHRTNYTWQKYNVRICYAGRPKFADTILIYAVLQKEKLGPVLFLGLTYKSHHCV